MAGFFVFYYHFEPASEQDRVRYYYKENGNIRTVPEFHTEAEWEEEWVD